MKITLVTAVYNRAGTIAGAIRSVTAQSYREIEHLVIDGASSDDTLAVVEAHRHPGLRLVSEPDRGIYDALNKGFAMASGEVLGLVHSDDFLAHERVVERVMAAFADPLVDAVYGDLDYVAAADTERVIRCWKAGGFSPRKLRRGWMPPHPALFIRRRLWEQYGVYDPQYRIAGDYDAILRWFGAGTGRGAITVVYLPEVLVKMRTGGESNRSLGRIFRKSREDWRALRANRAGGLFTLAAKNLRKVPQFFVR